MPETGLWRTIHEERQRTSPTSSAGTVLKLRSAVLNRHQIGGVRTLAGGEEVSRLGRGPEGAVECIGPHVMHHVREDARPYQGAIRRGEGAAIYEGILREVVVE